jgi:hypothetical protein
MKTKLLSCLASIVVLVIGGNAAQATMVAGWDFSSYAFDGVLSTDGLNLTNTLAANYSDLAAPGPASAGFGTMHLDGLFGSTDTPLDGTDPFVPSAAAGGSLASNLDAPAGPDFDSFGILTSNGQQFTNPFVMTALALATVVFEVDLGLQQGSDWSLTFGGRTASGGSNVGIEFSTDGSIFNPVTTVNLTAVDTLFTTQLTGPQSSSAFVRLSFNPTTGQEPFIDNLAINASLPVPEPATAALLLAGLAGLVRAGRRRA